jgi:hypothetical protein
MSIKDEVLSCMIDAMQTEEQSPDDIDPDELATMLGISQRSVIARLRKAIKDKELYAGHNLKEIRVRNSINNAKIMFRIIDPT